MLFDALLVVTPVRTAPVPGDGLGTMLHAVPFQCSMRVLLLPYTAALKLSPTAHTSVGLFALIALKANSALGLVPGTSGIRTTFHEAPFQCSAYVSFASS